MKHIIETFKTWMDERGLSALDVASSLGTEEQTIRKWRSQGVPERRRAHVEHYMNEWSSTTHGTVIPGETSVLRIEFTDTEIDDVNEAANIVHTPVREFIRRAAVHQARAQINSVTPPKKANGTDD